LSLSRCSLSEAYQTPVSLSRSALNYYQKEEIFSKGKFLIVFVLLIDIVMPKMNGFELYEKVKEIDDKAKACFITAHEVYYESLRDLFPGFEVDCFMRKPIENEELLRKVLSVI